MTPINPEIVRDIVLADCKLSIDELESDCRKGRVTFARAIITNVLRDHTGMSYPEISKLIRTRHTSHATAKEGDKRVRAGSHDDDATTLWGIPTTGMDYARYVWHRADEATIALSSVRFGRGAL
jgi:hypothetical protein